MRTDNELIAEFMDEEVSSVSANFGEPIRVFVLPRRPISERKTGRPIEAKYDTSWGWLMPVVEKIHKTKGSHVIIRQTSCEVYMWGKLISGNGQESFIQSVHKSVVDFIKWYNDQKK